MTDAEQAATVNGLSLKYTLRRVQLVLLAAALVDALLLAWFRHIGADYYAHIFNAAMVVLILLYGHNIIRVLYLRMVSLVGLYFAAGYAILSAVVLPDTPLVFLNLIHQPIQFLWFKINAGLILLLAWLVFELRKPCVTEAILKAKPLSKDIIGPDKKSLPYVFQLVFVTVFLAIMYSSLLPASNNKQFSARAVREAELSLRKNSVDEKYRIWGKVIAYDGKSLQSIPVEWTEK